MVRPHLLEWKTYTDFLNHAVIEFSACSYGEPNVSLQRRGRHMIRILLLASVDKKPQKQRLGT